MKPRSLLSYTTPYRSQLWVGFVFLMLTNGLEKAIPWVLKLGVDAFSSDALSVVGTYALWVALLALGMMVTRVLSRVMIFNVGRHIEFTLRNELLQQMHQLGASFFARISTGDIMSRATNDLGQVRLMVGFGILNLINAVVAYVSALALMVTISPTLTLYALIPYPFFIIMTRTFARAMYRRSQDNQKALATLAERAQEYLAGVRVVRAFAADTFEAERFEKANQHAVKSSMALVTLRALMFPVLMGLSAIGTLVVLYRGGLMVNDGQLTKGEFLAFYAYLAQLTWPTMAFGYILSVVQRGRAAYDRVREVLDAQPDIEEASEPIAAKVGPGGRLGEGALAVRDLHFAHNGQPVLDGVDFEVEAGRSVALMGRTGAGKSTLAGLLPRLLPTPQGAVYLDDTDVTQMPLRDVRKAVGYAQQEPFLFSTTVARNIGFALEDPDSDESMRRIREAATDASIIDEIERMPEGFDTIVGERGVQLSGGQKQRIALARALLNDPAVLLLDDPLSAVDAKTERTILGAFEKASRGRTLVLVTHRTAAAARCDEIVVLDEGKVIERGSHDELLRQGGFYAQLDARQSLEAELVEL